MSDITPPPANPAPSSGGLPPALANISSSTLEWVKVAGGALAFIGVFLPWYTVSFSNPLFGSISSSFNGFDDGIWGFLILLLGLAVAALAVIKVRNIEVPALQKLPPATGLWLGVALGVLAVFRWLVLLFDAGVGSEVDAFEGLGGSAGTSIGIWLVWLGGLAVLAATLLPVVKARKN
jgi:hypothetical protein